MSRAFRLLAGGLGGASLLVGCSAGPRPASHGGAVQEHVYAQPLDEALAGASAVLAEQGWQVERRGDRLGTRWRPEGTGALAGLRVSGVRIDAEHCTVHIESVVAVPLGSPIEDRQARSSGMGGDLTAGANRTEASDSLGPPPPGLVALSRGRDEGLEWAVLMRLEPRAARALEGAGTGIDGGARPAPSLTLPGGAPAVLAPRPDCGPPLDGLEPLVRGRRLVLLEDVPGTSQVPALVAQLACQAAEADARTVVVLPLLRDDQELVDTYLASAGTPTDRDAFLELSRTARLPSARAALSEAMLGLLDGLRRLRDAGLPLRALAFDDRAAGAEGDRRRARTVELARRADPGTVMVVVLAARSARTLLPPGETADRAPVGWYLVTWGLHPVSLAARFPAGEAWQCPPDEGARCGPEAVEARPAPPGTPVPSVNLLPAADGDGFAGTFAVGRLTASPPATRGVRR
ncbi:MAG TPA: hypothetical protein VEJ89_03160 [Myxococcaceae bacterium]|nr:hypothetical protein [Myxococcaceae bacterium]